MKEAPKKFRKRDVLTYSLIIVAVLAVVILAAKAVEHFGKRRAGDLDRDDMETGVTTVLAPISQSTDALGTDSAPVVTIQSTAPATTAIDVTTSNALETALEDETKPASNSSDADTTKAQNLSNNSTASSIQTAAADADTPEQIDLSSDTGKPEEAVSEDELEDWGPEGTYNNNIKNILLLGIDKPELGEQKFYRTAGQSDVMMVLSMNMKTKEYFIVTINRDLAVPVENYSAIGESYGFVTEQICLAYAYGDGTRISGNNAMKSVHFLLGDDVPFLGYIAAPFSIVSIMADAVDGVPVVIEDDFTGVDDTFKIGQTVVLRGKHAETFCRARYYMKTSYNNENRMTRQIAFCTSFINKAKSTLTAKQAVQMYDDLMDMMVTDMGKKDITKWILNAYDYTFKGFYRIDGEYGELQHNANSMIVDKEAVKALVNELYFY